MYMIIMPTLQVLAACIAWRFPIHTRRLAELQLNQARVFKVVDSGPLRQHGSKQHGVNDKGRDAAVTACVLRADDDMDMDDRITTMDARISVQRSQHSVQQNKQAAGDVHLVLAATKTVGSERSAIHAGSKWAVAVRSHVL
jgi:hypothetical protein